MVSLTLRKAGSFLLAVWVFQHDRTGPRISRETEDLYGSCLSADGPLVRVRIFPAYFLGVLPGIILLFAKSKKAHKQRFPSNCAKRLRELANGGIDRNRYALVVSETHGHVVVYRRSKSLKRRAWSVSINRCLFLKLYFSLQTKEAYSCNNYWMTKERNNPRMRYRIALSLRLSPLRRSGEIGL